MEAAALPPPATAEGFIAADADFLADNGFNSVRIGILFSGVMPQPGVIDQTYLDRWQRVVDLLAAKRIWVMIDFHQDLFSEKFQGEGFPDWAVHQPLTGVLPDPVFGFPGNYFTPQVSEVFDQLYANAGGVRDRVAQAWAAVAERFRDQPYLMGYDLINEPWPGIGLGHLRQPGGLPRGRDRAGVLPRRASSGDALEGPAQHRLVRAERAVRLRRGVWACRVRSPIRSWACPGTTTACRRRCCTPRASNDLPGCEDLESLVFDNARALADRLGATQVLSEFGASDDLPDIALMTQQADDNLVGWQYWHYKLWRDPTTESQTSGAQGLFVKDDDLSTLKPAKADLLIRSYPMATAGKPEDLDYDTATGELRYTYSPGPVAGVPLRTGATTDVFLSPRRYPHGYVATVAGGRVVSPPGARILQIATSPGARSVTVSVRAGSTRGVEPPNRAEPTGRLAATGSSPWLAALGLLGLVSSVLVGRRLRAEERGGAPCADGGLPRAT